MKIAIDSSEINLLHKQGIDVDPNRDYTEDEVFDILDQVRDVEIFYAQDCDTDKLALHFANVYGDLADKIQYMIPEE
ncbi:MAG: hypothetical protein LUE89_03045 [Clostridiales bacterium]|nr:hypothetical protein [Clostridiales bacterium]